MADEMSMAERLFVPLYSRCSRKCDTPDWDRVSSREPTPTHTPNDTLRIAGTASVRMRNPLGSTVRRTVPPNGSSAIVQGRARLIGPGYGGDARHPRRPVPHPPRAPGGLPGRRGHPGRADRG